MWCGQYQKEVSQEVKTAYPFMHPLLALVKEQQSVVTSRDLLGKVITPVKVDGLYIKANRKGQNKLKKICGNIGVSAVNLSTSVIPKGIFPT